MQANLNLNIFCPVYISSFVPGRSCHGSAAVLCPGEVKICFASAHTRLIYTMLPTSMALYRVSKMVSPSSDELESLVMLLFDQLFSLLKRMYTKFPPKVV